jgi:NAD(P)-dependent dehydrogenase (short-subunit alcohol dehydrogenase family)
MPNEPKTVTVTGASRSIGAALVKTFLERGYCVVAASLGMGRTLSSLSVADVFHIASRVISRILVVVTTGECNP